MFDIIYRFDPAQRTLRQLPATAAEARQRLAEGNLEFASTLSHSLATSESRVVFFDLEDIGIGITGGAPRQQPFAVVLGCADARVPTELIFNRACNELFVVRVAGNLLGQEVLGSIDYAVQHFNSLKLLVVLGHSHCGAVTAAVDAFLRPSTYLAVASSHPLRSVINGLLPAVRGASAALEHVWGKEVESQPGYRTALIEAAITLNAALAAAVLKQDLGQDLPPGALVVYGVYDLESRRVGVSLAQGVAAEAALQLVEPPHDREGFVQLGSDVAKSDAIRRWLTGNPL